MGKGVGRSSSGLLLLPPHANGQGEWAAGQTYVEQSREGSQDHRVYLLYCSRGRR